LENNARRGFGPNPLYMRIKRKSAAAAAKKKSVAAVSGGAGCVIKMQYWLHNL